MKRGYLALGQRWGSTLLLGDPKKSARKQLLEHEHCKSCKKMYTDSLTGVSVHSGYIVGDEWWRILEVHDWEGTGR
jgi:hypothetical protein